MSENEVKYKKSIIDKIKSSKKLQFVIIAICLIIAIYIVIVSFQNKNEKQVNSIDNYVENLEKRLSQTLSKVDGAGDVDVVITVESGMRTVLATKTTTTENSFGVETVETPIVVNGKTVVISEMYPEIVGVLIVCKGANNISVMTKLHQATISLLDININQIEILSK